MKQIIKKIIRGLKPTKPGSQTEPQEANYCSWSINIIGPPGGQCTYGSPLGWYVKTQSHTECNDPHWFIWCGVSFYKTNVGWNTIWSDSDNVPINPGGGNLISKNIDDPDDFWDNFSSGLYDMSEGIMIQAFIKCKSCKFHSQTTACKITVTSYPLRT